MANRDPTDPKNQDQRQPQRRSSQWDAQMEEAWPHLRGALWRRLEQGEVLDDLAGVIIEHKGDDEPFVTVGVVRRDELAQTIREDAGAHGARWVERLLQPTPVGCVPVFGALMGHSEVCILGPIMPASAQQVPRA